VPEWAVPVFRAVQEYLAGVRAEGGEIAAEARRVGEALGVGLAEVAAAVKGDGAAGAGLVMSYGGFALPGLAFAGVAEVRASAEAASAAAVRPEDVGDLSARASRDGIAGLSPMQLFILVLVWMLALGLPAERQGLPPEVQAMLSDYYGTVGVAVSVTALILGRVR
jgi:hypothetical protein